MVEVNKKGERRLLDKNTNKDNIVQFPLINANPFLVAKIILGASNEDMRDLLERISKKLHKM